MFVQDSFLEKAWDDLLSRDTDRIKSRFRALDPQSQKTVMEHLQKMVSESGWHPEQVVSATFALQTLSTKSD
jgi:hypothetical protein